MEKHLSVVGEALWGVFEMATAENLVFWAFTFSSEF